MNDSVSTVSSARAEIAGAFSAEHARASSRRLRLWIAAGLVLLAAAAVLRATWTESPDAMTGAANSARPDSAAAGADSARGMAPMKGPNWSALHLASVEKAGNSWTDPIPGRVRIDDRLTSKVNAPVGGRVSRVLVDLGQQVKHGDPLFVITSPDCADLRAQREKCAIDLQAAAAAKKRVEAMVEQNAAPAKDLLTATQELNQAELAEKLAVAKLDALHLAGNASESAYELVVSSPRDGAVVEKNLVANQVVTPDGAQDLLVIADLSSVWVVAELFEGDASEIKEGASVDVMPSGASKTTVHGDVEMISSVVDPSRHTVPVRVKVSNEGGALRPNAYATVRFAIDPDVAGLTIPSSAILYDGERSYVYVRGQGDSFVRREIVTGPASNGRTRVLQNLTAGETIVAEGGILLDNLLHPGS
jgi:RND family efflux transporter MFP subunit